jgi:hypothetical protein
MPSIIVIEKNGTVKETNIKKYSDEELYKKAGFKTNEGFKCYTLWNVSLNDKTYCISLYGKTTGRANQENKYEFPPPVDNTLFFGNCVLTNTDNKELLNLTAKEWTAIYEHLYGGFEDLDEENSEEDDDYDEEDMIGVKLTKEGYVKDDFIVDDDDDDMDDDDEDEDDEDYEDEEVVVKKSKKPAPKKKKPCKKDTAAKPLNVMEVNEDNYLDCTDELEEEAYV